MTTYFNQHVLAGPITLTCINLDPNVIQPRVATATTNNATATQPTTLYSVGSIPAVATTEVYSGAPVFQRPIQPIFHPPSTSSTLFCSNNNVYQSNHIFQNTNLQECQENSDMSWNAMNKQNNFLENIHAKPSRSTSTRQKHIAPRPNSIQQHQQIYNNHQSKNILPNKEDDDLSLIERHLELNEKHTVHWFRKGLRLHDNPALREGLNDATTFRCVFILDPWFAGSSNVGINKWRFLLQCLEDLDFSLRKINSRLFVIRGQPADALPKLFKKWGTTYLTFEEDPEPYGQVRDATIKMLCKDMGITVLQRVSHTLYKLDLIIEKNSGRAPLTYHQFQTIIASMDPPPQAEGTVSTKNIGKAITPLSEHHDEKYGVPTLEELGFNTEKISSPIWQGGESEALERLERHLERKAWVASFGRPKMTPQSLLASQTGLSPYLRFGCLSTRLFYYQLTELYVKIKKAQPPLSLHGQLLWREFFYCAATKNSNFDRMVGNPICVQIPWDHNPQALAKWANGQTGFPWIDAIMAQLREEGWIHHLARHAVACFLTRGDLWISWEEGMKVFEELLLDADWSVNAGTWMWLSCSSFFQQFIHCYCPVRFGRKADPNGDYIRRYQPILKNFPTKFIHEPWMAPEIVQKAAKCIIGKDYPMPIVDHNIVSKINLERMKQVYRRLSNYRPNNSEIDKKNLINAAIEHTTYVTSPSPNSTMQNINEMYNNITTLAPIIEETNNSSPMQQQQQYNRKDGVTINNEITSDGTNIVVIDSDNNRTTLTQQQIGDYVQQMVDQQQFNQNYQANNQRQNEPQKMSVDTPDLVSNEKLLEKNLDDQQQSEQIE